MAEQNFIDRVHQTRPPFEDLGSGSEFKVPDGYNQVSLKYDGINADILVMDREAFIHSGDGGMLKAKFDLAEWSPQLWLHGEFMFGQQWSSHPDRNGKVFLYDVTYCERGDIRHLPYRTRFAILETIVGRLHDPRFQVVDVYPMYRAQELWDTFVMRDGWEGLVFRDSESPYEAMLGRTKRTYTQDYLITGVVEGQGKHAGRLGAFIVEVNGVEGRVGGGFSDGQRQEIWDHRDEYIGRFIECRGYGLFASGLLRHPQFLRFRDDKTVLHQAA